MLTVEINDHAIKTWFAVMPNRIQARLEKTVFTLAQKLRNHIIRDKLMGQVLKRRTGRLGQSIDYRVAATPASVVATVFSSGDVPYARIHEYGGRTAAHVIEARNKDALAFMMGGQMIFRKKVNHPGSTMPERSFMRSSLRDMQDEITKGMRLAVVEGANHR